MIMKVMTTRSMIVLGGRTRTRLIEITTTKVMITKPMPMTTTGMRSMAMGLMPMGTVIMLPMDMTPISSGLMSEVFCRRAMHRMIV